LEEDNSRKPGVPRGTFLTYSSDLGSERMTPPGRTWRWSVDGQPLDDDLYPSMLIPCEDISLAWRRVPLPPWNAIRLLRGRVNSQEFMGHPPRTVLFLGARTRRDFQIPRTGQSPVWRIDYHFKVRSLLSTADGVTPRGWNCLYRGEDSSGEHWLEIEDASGHPPYVADDFAPLFQFGQ
jgi:hypothetical protein